MTLKTILSASAAMCIVAGTASAQEVIDIINCGDGSGGEATLQQEHIDAWLAENEGYEVTVEYVPWSNCQEKSITLASAGDAPAIAYMGSRVLKQLAESGLIRPFELSEEEASSYEPSVLSTVEFQGQIWGLPRAFSTKALYYNKDLFAEAGVDMPDGPQTFADVVEAARLVTENTDAAGFGMPAASFDNTMHGFLNWMYSNGGQVLNDEGEVVFDSQPVIETLQFYADLVPYSEDGPVAYDRAELEPLFREGQIAMYVNGGWGRAQVGDVDYGLAPIPVGPSGDGHSTLLITDSLVVFEGTGVEDAATDLVKFLTSTDRQAAFDEAGGWTPIRQTEYSEQLIKDDPTWAVFIDAIPTGGPEPSLVDYVGMQDAINEAIQGVVLGEVTPEEAAAQAAEDLRDLAD